jgi:putative endopeptidase
VGSKKYYLNWEGLMKAFLKTTVAVAALLTAACSDNQQSTNSEAGGEVADTSSVKPELGAWGIDLSAAKQEVKPGDDFFVAANGAWLDTFEIPADRSGYGAFTVLSERSRDNVKVIIDDLSAGSFEAGSVEQKISDYYNSYMDVEAVNARGITPLQSTLGQIAAISTTSGLVSAFGREGLDGSVSPISSGVWIDRGNPDRYTLNLGVGGLGLPDRDYYLEDSERFTAIRTAYVSHIAEMLNFAGVEDTAAKAAAILALETRIAEKHWPRADRRNRDKTYNPMSYADFKMQYDGFDWDQYLSVGGIENVDNLNVLHPDAVLAAIELINVIPVKDWKAYLTYHVINNHAGLLSDEIDAASFDFYGKVIGGRQEEQERWKRAVARVGVRGALGQRIEGLDWMGEETKQEALKKLASFNPKIAYPDVWRDLSGLEIVEGDLFQNAMNIRMFNHADQVARLSRPTNRDEWGMTPQTVNAYYNAQFNEIVFPAAILQPPFFDPAADPAVNYGGIGAVIGHEMGHGFDDQGSKSDDKGIQRNWWTEKDRANFEVKTTALAEQYNQFEPIPGAFVDGNFTLGENIGDLGGLSMAYHAYKLSLGGKPAPVIDGLTGDQRFFLSWAQVWKRKTRDEALLSLLKSDPHSPGRYRVNGVVRNMDEWYSAFDIKEGDAMYLAPEDRVSIW